jgi:predicted Rossmann-fold nucleotide-binding protein
MQKIQSLAIFCGSSQGNNPRFTKIAQELGKYLALHQIKMIYGGAHVGLMGEIANSCLYNKGQVVGVIPRFLSQKEIVHEGLRKARMIGVPGKPNEDKVLKVPPLMLA